MPARQPQSDGSLVAGARRHWRRRLSPRAGGRSARMAEFQRSRLLKAALAVVSEHGYAELTASAVIARAGVSRKTFYDLFGNRDDCLLALLEDSLAQLDAVVTAAYQAPGSWSERLRAALTALLVFLESEPETAALVLSYLLGQGPQALEPRASVLRLLQRAVDRGRSEARSRHALSPLTAELVVGGVLAVVDARLQSSPRRLRALVNPLMWTIVLPYLGPAAAARQLTRVTPARVPAPPAPAISHLRRVNMRLTYRTAKALEVIAAAPGASNTEISARVGIADQGQISKLLARLARLELIENVGAGQPSGAANAWHLTASGSELESAIRRTFATPR
jgi:AcrR family transcriptional regulator